MEILDGVVGQFCVDGKRLRADVYGSGNINDTYLVTLQGGDTEYVILQRVNQRVFVNPESIMLNMRTWMDHVNRRLAQAPTSSGPWIVPQIIPARDGRDYVIDPEGGFWRALRFIEGARTYALVQNVAHAREVGIALGRFQALISDLEPTKLYDTLPGYHIMPQYLSHYDEVLARQTHPSATADIRYGREFVAARRAWASVLEDAKARGILQLRPIHGDPKVDNVMIDDATGKAISIVDLDTVKPGLVHYDIGDCLRSCCNPLGEETTDVSAVTFEMDLCEAILTGYLSIARCFLCEADYDYLYDAVRMLAVEQGLRFFTDYLEGDVYYKVKHRGHNLQRALVQFKLAESIEAHETEIRTLIRSLVRA